MTIARIAGTEPGLHARVKRIFGLLISYVGLLLRFFMQERVSEEVGLIRDQVP